MPIISIPIMNKLWHKMIHVPCPRSKESLLSEEFLARRRVLNNGTTVNCGNWQYNKMVSWPLASTGVKCSSNTQYYLFWLQMHNQKLSTCSKQIHVILVYMLIIFYKQGNLNNLNSVYKTEVYLANLLVVGVLIIWYTNMHHYVPIYSILNYVKCTADYSIKRACRK